MGAGKRKWAKLLPTNEVHAGGDRLGDQEVLSHAGSRGKFHDIPRPGTDQRGPEHEISAVRGLVTVDEVIRCAFSRPATKRDCVRYLPVGPMREAGYVPIPTPRPARPLHVSIYGGLHPDETPAWRDWWTDPERVTLTDIAAEHERS